MPGKVATETRDACFERLLDRFPWPEVPSPTNQRVIVKEVLRDAEPLPLHASGGAAVAFPNGPRTLGQLLQHLRSRLDRAGYPAPPVLGAGCNGFALILEGESVRADGSRIAFEQWNQSKGLGLIDILDKLFRGEPGFYRMIVIVASSEKPVEGGGPITADALRRLLTLGSSGLPVGMEGIPFDERYELYALVYEFEKTAASSPTQVVPAGRIPMQTHLRAAGLVATQ